MLKGIPFGNKLRKVQSLYLSMCLYLFVSVYLYRAAVCACLGVRVSVWVSVCLLMVCGSPKFPFGSEVRTDETEVSSYYRLL